MKKIILVGAGGHANSVYDVIRSTKKFKIEKILDENISRKKFFNLRIEKQKKFLLNNKLKKNIHLSFSSMYDLKKRHKLFLKLLKKENYSFPKIISSNAYVSKDSIILDGSIVMHNAIVNSKTKIGYNVVINTKALIEHDVTIGDNFHISTGAIINGHVVIGSNCFIGSGTIIRENIKIPDNSFIKMGSIIKK